jgi:glycyl-tRNA synthetase
MASFSRPTRIVRGKEVDPAWAVNPALFELQEERDLHTAVTTAKAAIGNPATVTVAQFLLACQPLTQPIAAYFDKVSCA